MEWLPYALFLGMTEQQFWDSNPRIIAPYRKAQELRDRKKDQDNYMLYQYMLSAVTYSVEHCLAGNKANTKTIEKPLLQEYFETKDMTEEELNERELKKMLMYEEQWSIRDKLNGLIETSIDD